MAMFIKNKNMAFSLILMCFIVVSPMANAQFGGLPGTNILNIQGLVTCSINGSVSTNGTVIPPFAGVPVVLQCAGQNVSTTTTGANGVFSFPSTTVFPISLLSTLLASGCRVIVTAPLSRCNASLPTNGLLTAPVNLVGSTVTGGISILQFVNGLFRLL
ncbi:Pollen Ole e 1 allergen and extensin family protein [Raphanus sativus]|uniref:Uncharacterized protein LOC108863464 n=1 Tax=Raphanus sativus TaxID=3726 RepID=A0A6J0P9Q0_RAPSA|nr:uncharacterized protein LOC108863464 [Raphanus sativus]KAJ4873665.1 Pollen Ole e 1 allergen and extensin family protein [Raphanus sativus]